ncbi:hypothetical protein DAETH_40740 (plasmid) [Deinococcus aetherius]|uniref:Uncharacterized protein n=1 Tax=Deinococcus aetherius TaxID=200252 RepID=A0ABM8AJV6_9DEIO|nr:hypothetical protein [Deinococcus aetherius]BDP44105.1 hypothetical protein DAETH_40740 [Deinococcus aetherius]
MTQPQEDDSQLSETAPGEDQSSTDDPTSADADEQGEGGQHGRPSDDSDPGHS